MCFGFCGFLRFIWHTQLSLYVGNLGPDIVEGVLYEKFGSIGAIASVRICRDSMTRRSLGYAYVNFINPDHAKTAIDEFNYEMLNNRPMRVMYSERNPQLRRYQFFFFFVGSYLLDLDWATFSFPTCTRTLTPERCTTHFQNTETSCLAR